MPEAPEDAPATDAPEPQPQPEPAPAPQPEQPQPEEPDNPLGEAGERALKREREARRAAEHRAKEAQEAAEKQVADLKREMSEELVGAKIEAAAAGKFADTSDALLNIDPGDVVDKNGKVDRDRLGAAIDALLERKPHLAAGATPRSNGYDNGAKPLTNGQQDMDSFIRQVAGRS